jgi:hypothetical protein
MRFFSRVLFVKIEFSNSIDIQIRKHSKTSTTLFSPTNQLTNKPAHQQKPAKTSKIMAAKQLSPRMGEYNPGARVKVASFDPDSTGMYNRYKLGKDVAERVLFALTNGDPSCLSRNPLGREWVQLPNDEELKGQLELWSKELKHSVHEYDVACGKLFELREQVEKNPFNFGTGVLNDVLSSETPIAFTQTMEAAVTKCDGMFTALQKTAETFFRLTLAFFETIRTHKPKDAETDTEDQ